MTSGNVHADIFFMTTTAASDAVSFDVSGLSVYGDHITVRIGSASGLHEIAVHETGSGTPLGAYTVTPSVPATTAVVPLSPVPHSTSLTITITALGSTPGALDTITFYLPRDTTVPTNIASNVCTGGGYRYGYNTQIKENEIAGIGNHYSALYWEYDPRVARRWNVDPVMKYGESAYACFNNQPITIADVRGDDGWDVVAGWTIGIFTNVVPFTGNWRDSYRPTDNADYNNTLRRVDNASMVVGSAVTGHGLAMIQAGAGTGAAGAAVAATGVGAPVGAAVAGAGGAMASTGALEVLVGVYFAATAGSNKAQGYDRGDKGHKESGSYTNHHKSGKKYHGKGNEKRAETSAKRIEKEHNDPLDRTDFTKAKNDREGFIQESERLENDGGYKSSNNYNQRDSPGKKYKENDSK